MKIPQVRMKDRTRQLFSLSLVAAIVFGVIEFGPDVASAINGEQVDGVHLELEQCGNGGLRRKQNLLPIEWLSPKSRAELESCYTKSVPMDFELQD